MTDRQTNKQTNRQTNNQGQTNRHRQTDRNLNRQTEGYNYNIWKIGSALLPTVIKINKTKFHYRDKDTHLTYLDYYYKGENSKNKRESINFPYF